MLLLRRCSWRADLNTPGVFRLAPMFEKISLGVITGRSGRGSVCRQWANGVFFLFNNSIHHRRRRRRISILLRRHTLLPAVVAVYIIICLGPTSPSTTTRRVPPE